MFLVHKMTYLIMYSHTCKTRQTRRHSPSRLPRTRQTRRHSPNRLPSTRQTRRHSPSRLPSTRQTRRHSPNRLPRTRYIRHSIHSTHSHEFGEFGASGHCLKKIQKWKTIFTPNRQKLFWIIRLKYQELCSQHFEVIFLQKKCLKSI